MLVKGQQLQIYENIGFIFTKLRDIGIRSCMKSYRGAKALAD